MVGWGWGGRVVKWGERWWDGGVDEKGERGGGMERWWCGRKGGQRWLDGGVVGWTKGVRNVSNLIERKLEKMTNMRW